MLTKKIVSGVCALTIAASMAVPTYAEAGVGQTNIIELSASENEEQAQLPQVNFTITTKKKGKVVVKWKKVKNATGYLVYYKQKSGEPWKRLAKLDANARKFVKTDLNKEYHGYILVRAFRKVAGQKTVFGKNAYQKVYKYPYAAKKLDKVGWNIRKAYKAAIVPYYDPNHKLPRDGKTTMEWYAKYGFKNGRGHCYVMAAMFAEMARTMGYDCNQIYGYIKTASGRAVHSWTEVTIDGETYVCDPQFENLHTDRDGYMFKYGAKNTWVYVRKGKVATNDKK